MSGFRVRGLWALGFEAWGFAACIGVQGLRFEELLFRVEGWEFSALGFGLRNVGFIWTVLEFMVVGLG